MATHAGGSDVRRSGQATVVAACRPSKTCKGVHVEASVVLPCGVERLVALEARVGGERVLVGIHLFHLHTVPCGQGMVQNGGLLEK